MFTRREVGGEDGNAASTLPSSSRHSGRIVDSAHMEVVVKSGKVRVPLDPSLDGAEVGEGLTLAPMVLSDPCTVETQSFIFAHALHSQCVTRDRQNGL